MHSTQSPKELVQAAKEKAGTLNPAQVHAAVVDGAELVDVREAGETSKGRIRGAHHIPRGTLEFKIEDVVPDKNRRIITYCSAGSRAALAAATLKTLGYESATASEAGFDDLTKHGFSVSVDDD